MVSRRAYFIDAGYSVKKGKTYVTLILKGKKTVKLYYQYDPYFLVDAPAEKTGELLKVRVRRKNGEQTGFSRIEEVEKHVGLEKKKLLKAYCHEPSDVPIIRTAVLFTCYEDNIPFAKRFVFDMQLCPLYVIGYERKGRLITKINKVVAGEPKLSGMAFDIETYNPGGAPIEEKDPIVMISYATEKNKGVITTKPSANAFVETVADEKLMIERFCQIIKKEDPDVLVGYNSANFDIPYLEKRSEKTKAKLILGKFSSQIKKLNKGLINGVRVDGRVHMDLFPMVKFFGFIGLIKAQRFTLNAVAEDVLGKKKVDVKKEEIWKLWDDNKIDYLSDYSLVDSELTLALGERFLPLEIELAGVAKLPLFETTISTSGQLVENLLMYHATEKGILIPSKPGGGAISERMAAPIQGAFVKLPEPGIYNNVAVLDFRGLYPSIIVSYNIDPGTLISEKDKHDNYTSPSGAHFAKKEFGLIPFVLDYLIDMRMVIKKEIKKLDKSSAEYEKMSARSHALKILANSIAGDEPLVLMSPRGIIKIISASEFIDPKLSDEFVGTTQLGNADGWKVASFKDNKVLFKKIKKVMRHGTRKLLKLKMHSGREIKVTQDHSVFSLGKNCKIAPISAKELKPDMPIVVPKRMKLEPSQKPYSKINLIKALLDAPLEETSDIMLTVRLGQEAKNLSTQTQILSELDGCGCSSPTKIGKSIGMEYRTISTQLHSLQNCGFVSPPKRAYPPFDFHITSKGKEYNKFIQSILPFLKYNQNDRKHFVMFNKIRENLDHIDEQFLERFSIGPINGTKIPANLNITPEVARLLGYYVSEGYSRKWKNARKGTSYRSEVTNYNQDILSDMEKCFSCLGVAVQRTKTTIVSNTKISYLIFKYVFGCGSNAYEKNVPEILLNSGSELKSEFLLAYYLGDGTYAPKQKMYKFTTVSRKLANSLCLLLLQLGISDFSLSKDTKFYRVHIWEDLPFVGLNKDKKGNRHFNRSVPGYLIKEEIKSLKNINYYYAKTKRISKDKLREFYKLYFHKFGRSQRIENILSILDGDLSLDSAKSIEKIEKEEYVYDLSVEGTENFIGGFGWTCLHNSFYGYMGYARSRWYSRACAESVTAWGRKHITETIEKAEKAGFSVLYSDTDSIFILYKDKKDVIEFMNKLNSSLPEKMELELEGFYPRGVFVSKKGDTGTGAKKKYALLGEDGRIKIRGFELVRRDWASIAKETQLKVLEAILKDGSKEKAVKIIREVVENIQSGKVPLQMLTISTQLNKNPSKYEVKSPELGAAKKLRDSGVAVEKGTMISFVIGKKGATISDKAVPIELAKDYDEEYYINHQILPAVMKIMKELGYDEHSMKFGGKQQNLDSFF